LIHDNAISEADGTREYLHSIADCGLPIADLKNGFPINLQSEIRDPQCKIAVFYGEKDLAHGEALDFLAGKVTAPWFITMDSDVEITRKDWVKEVEAVIAAHPGMVLCAVGQTPGVRGEDNYSMARIDPSFALVSTEFFRGEGLSFQVLALRATALTPRALPGALKGKRSLTWTGDTGWQLLHAALRSQGSGLRVQEQRHGISNIEQGISNDEVNGASADGGGGAGGFVPMPVGLRTCYVHHGSRSIQFHESGGGAMNAGDLVEVVYSAGPGIVRTIQGRLAVRANPDIVLTDTVELVEGKEVRGLTAVIPRRREVLTRLVERKSK
jgi:hypothetical protein